MKLNGKVAFVTGFGSGLGQAIAVLFASEGAAGAGKSKTEGKGRETVEMIERAGGKAFFRPGDVGKFDTDESVDRSDGQALWRDRYRRQQRRREDQRQHY